MEDPPHRVWFEGYGEYTLEFEVWFFAPFGDGLRLKTELYSKLVRRLEQAGIEVPVPTRDVRVEHEDEVLGASPPG